MMRRATVLIWVMFLVSLSVVSYADEAKRTHAIPSSPYYPMSQGTALHDSSQYSVVPSSRHGYPAVQLKEWYILAKDPTSKNLKIGVFLLQEGMPLDHIYHLLGDPKENVTPDIEGCGTILAYPRHYLFFSEAGYLRTIKER